MGAQVRRQTYDRRRRREEAGSRPNHRNGELEVPSVLPSQASVHVDFLPEFGLTTETASHGRPMRGNGPRDETYHTAPESPPFDHQGAFLPGGTPPNLAYPPVPLNGYGDYGRNPAAQPRNELDEVDFAYGNREARSPPGQRHVPNFANGGPNGRGRRMRRERKSPQGPDEPYMSGAVLNDTEDLP